MPGPQLIRPDAAELREVTRMVTELSEMNAGEFYLKELLFLVQPSGHDINAIKAQVETIYNRVVKRDDPNTCQTSENPVE
jgi:hypothetical protein